MDFWRNYVRRWLWVLALVAMTAFVTYDTVFHLHTTYYVSNQHLFTAPAPDPSSPTGYAFGQRDAILPYVGMDGYHWVMQTQQMLDDGNPRVRWVDYDNYDHGLKGREMYWSSSFRWWVAGLAWLEHAYGAVPLPMAVEDVMPFANTLLIVLLVILITPTMVRRFGSGPAALLAVGMASVYPLYESFIEGKSDHHGLAALSAMLTVVCLVGGAAGWIRNDTSDESINPNLRAWLPNRPQARRWFIASAIAGGVGLWVSTASEAPVLVELGLSALLATGWLGRGTTENSPAKPDPSLWRAWGWAGAATSVFFYLLEYFPFHMGWRLEVNHPLYALAWAGGGELVYRLSLWWSSKKAPARFADWAWLIFSALAVALLPLVIWLYSDKVFWVADRFLFIFHEDYIAEFKDMGRYLSALVKANESALLSAFNALFLLFIPLLAWTVRGAKKILLGALVLALPFYLYVLCKETLWPLDEYFWAAEAIPTSILMLVIALSMPWPDFSAPAKALMLVTLPPVLITMGLSIREMRWMEIGYALLLGALVAAVVAHGLSKERCETVPFKFHALLAASFVISFALLAWLLSANSAIWLAPLVTMVTALLLPANYRWVQTRRVLTVAFLAWVLLPGPLQAFSIWYSYGWNPTLSDVELMEMVTRDASQQLRARLGDETGVVVSGPTTTTWMIYWGGFKGLGTLYWENLEGLKATAAIYSAPNFDEALKLIQARGVTHIAIYSWDPFYKEYARLSRGLHVPTTEAGQAAEVPKLKNDFVYSMIEGHTIPPWLRPIYYQMPNYRNFAGHWVMIYEVVPNQSPEEALVRLAEYENVQGNQSAAVQTLTSVLQTKPDFLPALISAARLLQARGETQNFNIIIEKIRAAMGQADSLEFDERLNLAITFVMAGDMPMAQQQILACIHTANVHNLRRTDYSKLFSLLSFLNQTDQSYSRPGLQMFVLGLLPEEVRLQLLVQMAHEDLARERSTAALQILQQGAVRSPDSPYVLNELARLLATAHDPTIRNGREAVTLALHLRELDHAQHADAADTLACAYAEAGEFALAVTIEQEALNKAEAAHATDVVEADKLRIALFKNKVPYHE